MIWLQAVYGQILTVLANVLVLCFLSSVSMLVSPFSTPIALYIHLASQPLIEQVRMGCTGFSKKRYMIGQDGRKPIGSCLGMAGLALFGLFFVFLSTIVFQCSRTSLQNTLVGAPPAFSETGQVPFTSTQVIKYPLLTDSLLDTLPLKQGTAVEPSKLWTHGRVPWSQSQFSGNSSIHFSDENWSIEDGDFVTSVSINIDGVAVGALADASPGTLKVQLLDKGLPYVFQVPTVSTNLGQAYGVVIQGQHSLDYLVFQLTAFDAIAFTDSDNLQQYYDYISRHTTNGTVILNNTFDYNLSKAIDKQTLEHDFADIDGTAHYSLLSILNQTTSTEFQEYALTKRAARRLDRVASQYATIEVVEYDYTFRIYRTAARLPQQHRVIHSGSGYAIPVSPFIRTNLADYLAVAAVTRDTALLAMYRAETYVDVLPVIILICVYVFLTLAATGLAALHNRHARFRGLAYSMPLELLNYLLYRPVTVLFPVLSKVHKAQLVMVDGYDRGTGCNHLGLVGAVEAERVAASEPDVPYGNVPRPVAGKAAKV